ncbi:MAG TPA: GNAT family N-acetyltransferase [Flavipsychrobacter sp.]|jgi:ribosomal protein S18 acetylase RimI-like enzyme|nr:GNAT family N-acetyltransferase [Flavipsychrobacter sp.]
MKPLFYTLIQYASPFGIHSPMEKIEIKKVTPDEVEQLQQISRGTFFEAFAAENTEENMQQYLRESLSVEKLTEELNDEHSEFYFALLDGGVIGYLKVNFGQSQTDIKDDKALEIERIYVLRQFYGKSIGQLLYEKAQQIAWEKNADYIWLGVWEHNLRAIRFYKKNGFAAFDKHSFMLGNDEQTDVMMKLTLRDNQK